MSTTLLSGGTVAGAGGSKGGMVIRRDLECEGYFGKWSAVGVGGSKRGMVDFRREPDCKAQFWLVGVVADERGTIDCPGTNCEGCLWKWSLEGVGGSKRGMMEIRRELDCED